MVFEGAEGSKAAVTVSKEPSKAEVLKTRKAELKKELQAKASELRKEQKSTCKRKKTAAKLSEQDQTCCLMPPTLAPIYGAIYVEGHLSLSTHSLSTTRPVHLVSHIPLRDTRTSSKCSSSKQPRGWRTKRQREKTRVKTRVTTRVKSRLLPPMAIPMSERQ